MLLCIEYTLLTFGSKSFLNYSSTAYSLINLLVLAILLTKLFYVIFISGIFSSSGSCNSFSESYSGISLSREGLINF